MLHNSTKLEYQVTEEANLDTRIFNRAVKALLREQCKEQTLLY